MTKNKRIEVAKVTDRGSLPAFVGMGHRHLEKEKPTVKEGQTEFILPVDLLSVAIGFDRSDLLDGIEEVSIGYRKAGK